MYVAWTDRREKCKYLPSMYSSHAICPQCTAPMLFALNVQLPCYLPSTYSSHAMCPQRTAPMLFAVNVQLPCYLPSMYSSHAICCKRTAPMLFTHNVQLPCYLPSMYSSHAIYPQCTAPMLLQCRIFVVCVTPRQVIYLHDNDLSPCISKMIILGHLSIQYLLFLANTDILASKCQILYRFAGESSCAATTLMLCTF